MVPCPRHDMHCSMAVTCPSQVLDGFQAALWVHPVMFAVCALRVQHVALDTDHKTRTYKGNRDLQWRNTVHQRPACVRPGRENMCWWVVIHFILADTRSLSLTDAVLPRSFGECDVEDIIMHVPRFFLRQSRKPSRSILHHGSSTQRFISFKFQVLFSPSRRA